MDLRDKIKFEKYKLFSKYPATEWRGLKFTKNKILMVKKAIHCVYDVHHHVI